MESSSDAERGTTGTQGPVLPDELLARARREPNGELTWSLDDAHSVIAAIRDGGGRITSVTLDRHMPDGGVVEEDEMWIAGGESTDDEAAEWAQDFIRARGSTAHRALMQWSSPTSRP